jgi:hypothetical protein
MMGRTIKALWVCGLLFLLAIAVYGRTLVTASDAGGLQSAMRTPPSIALPALSLSPLVEVIAGDAAPGSSRSQIETAAMSSASGADSATTDLSAYVFLHQTRDVNTDVLVVERANACPE